MTFAVLLILGIGGCAAIRWLDRDDASNELRTMTRELAQVQVPASTYRSKTHVGHRDCQRYQQNRTSRTERSSLGVQPLWTRLHHRVLALGWTDAGPVNPSGDHLHIHVERGFRDLYLDLKPMARGTSVELMEEGTGTECF